ncbi:MAG: glycosyltransferase [Patescibacteria group bacterium]
MKFSIVTPSYNMETWISRTIESIVTQEGDFELEYILADGNSTDRTVALFEEYRARIERKELPVRCRQITMKSFSEKDSGTFDAINKGFACATGDVYTWADADNTYTPGALEAVRKTFDTFPDIAWVHGVSGAMNNRWEETASGTCRLYREKWLREGVYGMESYPVAQNGCFWRAALWKKVGPIPTELRVAGDYWLWQRMARHASMWSLDVNLGTFMRRPGQLHTQGGYRAEQWSVRPKRSLAAWQARIFFTPQSRAPKFLQPFFLWLYSVLYIHGEKPEYIAFENGVPKVVRARSFIC